jgi:hypothetical protein
MLTNYYCRRGDDLKELVDISRESATTVILDEVSPCFSNQQLLLIFRLKFYSWYIYHDDETHVGKSISSAEYVEDVNGDSVVIVDGLTKVLIYSSDTKVCH